MIVGGFSDWQKQKRQIENIAQNCCWSGHDYF